MAKRIDGAVGSDYYEGKKLSNVPLKNINWYKLKTGLGLGVHKAY